MRENQASRTFFLCFELKKISDFERIFPYFEAIFKPIAHACTRMHTKRRLYRLVCARRRIKVLLKSQSVSLRHGITAALREHMFFSFAAVKEAVAERLEFINTKPFQKRPGCRREAYLKESEPLQYSERYCFCNDHSPVLYIATKFVC